MKTIRIIASGRVQGVYFRVFTQKQAKKLGITGYVKNNADGSVEIVSSAEQEKLDQLINWCYKGPVMAKVTNVDVYEFSTAEKFSEFEIR